MNIIIHRGQNQIGGSIIEISSATTRIIFDTGAELEETEPVVPEVDGLFCGLPSVDAVFISHYHGDHIGLCDKILPGIPVYIGEAAERVTNAARTYLRKSPYTFVGNYESGVPMQIGDITVTPYLCDHSAFDSYMFHVERGGKTLLYSGDFRANGRKSFPALLKRLPPVDALIVEGTTLSRSSAAPATEGKLEQRAIDAMKGIEAPVFILMAATNIDRVVTVYRSAKRSGRIMLQDLYLAAVSCVAGGSIPNPEAFSDVRVFMTSGGDARHEELEQYGQAKIGRKAISEEHYVMCVRPSMQAYLEKLSELTPFDGGILFYSMWDGYRNKQDISDFLNFMQSKGVRIVPLHTSGHADADTIDALVRDARPSVIIPVHTENAAWFRRYTDANVVTTQSYDL